MISFFRISPFCVIFMFCSSPGIKAAKLFKFVTYICFNMKRHVCLTLLLRRSSFVFFLIGAETLYLCILLFFYFI